MTDNKPARDGFEKLLEQLDPDRKQAEAMLVQLLTFVRDSLRGFGCRDEVDDMASETLLRLADRARSVTFDNVYAFSYRVARLVSLEYFRDQKKRPAPEDNPADRDAVTIQEFVDASRQHEDLRQVCFAECLAHRTRDELELLNVYHDQDSPRWKRDVTNLARKWNKTRNALAIHVCRLNERVRTCVETCNENKARAA